MRGSGEIPDHYGCSGNHLKPLYKPRKVRKECMTTKSTLIKKLGSEEAYRAYMQEIGRKGGRQPKDPPHLCSLCSRKHFARGYCSKHYYREVTKKNVQK